MTHQTEHPLSGQTVTLSDTTVPDNRDIVKPGEQYRIEDWYDRLGQGTWQDGQYNNWACRHYAARVLNGGLPHDNEVVYGHIDGLGHLIHVSELS